MIIGICGWQGSGKDTIADYLVNFNEYRRDSFAATLKDAIAIIFGWDRELLEGRTHESRAWREQVDPWWAERFNIPHLTPRWVLQYWGTEVCRTGFHDDMWIACLENKLRKTADNSVITDCRFPNEIKTIKERGGKVIWVKRGPMPAWYEFARLANTGDAHAADMLSSFNIHASETSWIGTEFDAVVSNDGTIAELYDQLKNLAQ